MILVLNSGSSSLKFKLYDINLNVLCSGLLERIGNENGKITIKTSKVIELEQTIPNHTVGLEIVFNQLVSANIINNLNEITIVGHRVVHGGELYDKAVVVDDDVLKNIEELSSLSPLHNPANAQGIKTVKQLLPKAINVAVFDTAYHQTMSPVEYLYPINYDYYKTLKVRRYGMHGTSHKYCANKIEELYGKKLKIINCHLGAGASLCAIKDGMSIATTMGLTPLAGIMMATRSGDIDPAIVQYLANNLDLTVDEVLEKLNKESGLLGVSQLSGDMRDIIEAINIGNEQAKLAFDLYTNRVVEEISKYIVKLNGVDVISFTAGVGENSLDTITQIIEKLKYFNIKIDNNIKLEANVIQELSTQDSPIKVLKIPANEELSIALETIPFIN